MTPDARTRPRLPWLVVGHLTYSRLFTAASVGTSAQTVSLVAICGYESGGLVVRRNRPVACSTRFNVFGHALRRENPCPVVTLHQ